MENTIKELRDEIKSLYTKINEPKPVVDLKKSSLQEIGRKARVAAGITSGDTEIDAHSGKQVVKSLNINSVGIGTETYPVIYDILPEYGVAFKHLHKIPISKQVQFVNTVSDPVAVHIPRNRATGVPVTPDTNQSLAQVSTA